MAGFEIQRIVSAAATTAYMVDYHLVPKRLTPGFELHLSGP